MMVLSMGTANAEDAKTQGFTLPALGYAYDALEPAIDAKTMEIHHTKHHQAYIDNLNKEVAAEKSLAGKSLEDIVAHVSKYNTATRNNAGGHWNHSLFWSIMSPAAETGKQSPELQKAITDAFGSQQEFETAFEKAGTSRFGSGWAWLIVGKDGKLQITSTANQDNPLMDVAEVKGTPILGNDLWEHAYYLSYQNKRADYLKSWWKVVNWTKVSDLYAAASKK